MLRVRTLTTLLRLRGWSQSDLAKKTNISRQLISKWLSSNSDFINLQSRQLIKVAHAFNITLDELLTLAPLQNSAQIKQSKTELLWDRLYPDLEAFAAAIARGQPEALARLVQVYGLFVAKKIAGNQIIKKFDDYKLKISPVYRKQAETLWQLLNNPLYS